MSDTIQSFNLLPRTSLEQLGMRLGLRMSLPELLFCARHYPMNGEIAVSTLQFLDALACPAYTPLAKIAVGELITAHAEPAEAFACAIADLKQRRKDPEKPYTLQDFATLALRDTKPTAPCAQCAAYGDALVLLHSFEEIDADLTLRVHGICDCTTESPMHAALRLCNGAVWELGRLPAHMQDALLLTKPCDAQLLVLPQDALPALLQAAATRGAQAHIIGVVTHNGTMEIRRDKQIVFSLPTAYLRKLCFIRAYTLQDMEQDLYRSVQRKAASAYVQAVEAGCDPAAVTLHARLPMRAQDVTSGSVTALLCMILGLYRFSDTMQVPVEIRTDLTAQDVRIQAGTQAGTALPRALQGKSRIYLLAPRTLETGMPAWQELRAVTAYLHKAVQEGKIKAIKRLCDTTPARVLEKDHCGVILNPHAAHALEQNYQYAFLVESDFDLCGELIAVSTLPKQAKSAEDSDNIS